MKLQKAIDTATASRPNAFSAEEAIAWLNELDHQLYLEVFLTHKNPNKITYTEYTQENSGAELLVPAPWDKLYPSYIKAKADEMYGEDTYNLSAAVYNQQLTEFKAYWNRTYMPVSTTQPERKCPLGIYYVYPEGNPMED